MSQEGIKVTDEEKSEVLDLRQKFTDKIYEIGQMEVNKKIIDRRLNTLFSEYEELEGKESELVQKLSDKYGNGYVDLEQGMFIKNES